MKPILCLLLAVSLSCASVVSIFGADQNSEIQVFFGKHCVACHGEEKQKGDMRLDDFSKFDAETWELIYEQIASQEMPPDDEPQPTDAERGAIQKHVLAVATQEGPATSTGFRRLNKREYGNTVLDLLGLRNGTFDPGEYVYEDEVDHGFDTEAESLVISNELLIEYMEAARKSLKHALFSAATEKPSTKTINVELIKMSGTSRRYINHHKDHVIGRSGGKAKLFDGSKSRVMKFPGRYKITVTASGVDRQFYPIRFTPEKGPLIMGFGVMPEGEASLSGQAVLQKTFELKDEVEQTFQFDTWIDKDHFPYFSFESGSGKPITQIRSNIRQRKIPASAMKELYRGPGVKITKFSIEGPFHDQWPPDSFQATYDSESIPDLNQSQEREDLLLRFANRAFRRPVTKDEIQPYVEFLNQQQAAKEDWHEALIETLSAMMASVDFLYIRDSSTRQQRQKLARQRSEAVREPAAQDASVMNKQGRFAEPTGSVRENVLSPYGLANRLSYFLWSTMPDDELFAMAESGEILEPDTLNKQVSRLLNDPRSSEFANSFTDQWLSLDTLGSMPPDVKAPQFKLYHRDKLEPAMREETRRFFRYILEQNRSIRDFIDSDYSFINQSLANLYGIPFSRGDEWVRVNFPANTKRGGLLGHGSVLALTSNGVETSPVERGHWVLEELLGTPPPPAPKEVPALVPDLNGATTVREQLEKHRSDPSCIECHRQMDPLGFAPEAYDPIGRLRSVYENKQPVTDFGTYKGEDFAGVSQLKAILAKDLRPFARNLAIKFAEYGKGRKLTPSDFAVIEEIVDSSAADNYPLREMIVKIATSDLMTHQ
ncbi:DUF1592 domain-containing protein [bacterium]|nr:DUF1592 domain-containing protein [bacterium]